MSDNTHLDELKRKVREGILDAQNGLSMLRDAIVQRADDCFVHLEAIPTDDPDYTTARDTFSVLLQLQADCQAASYQAGEALREFIRINQKRDGGGGAGVRQPSNPLPPSTPAEDAKPIPKESLEPIVDCKPSG